jgi:hypothetical protein
MVDGTSVGGPGGPYGETYPTEPQAVCGRVVSLPQIRWTAIGQVPLGFLQADLACADNLLSLGK